MLLSRLAATHREPEPSELVRDTTFSKNLFCQVQEIRAIETLRRQREDGFYFGPPAGSTNQSRVLVVDQSAALRLCCAAEPANQTVFACVQAAEVYLGVLFLSFWFVFLNEDSSER